MTTVNYTPDPKKTIRLTEEQDAKLEALADEDIDYSDIPELDDDFWENVTPVTPDLTKPVTLRVKQSVLQYFQASGKKGYQSRMNAVLESYVLAQKKLEQNQQNP
ncbi:MAG: BrnA antitoxin family protein [Cyanobacteria bacterium P01_G01_bin.39]